MKLVTHKKFSMRYIGILCLMFLMPQAIALGADDTRPAEFAYANEQLNKIYKKILERMDSTDQIEVRKSQRAWIIFRDLDCAWAHIGESLDCLIDKTNSRTKELQEFFDVKGNYLSGNKNDVKQ